jgi:guanylate kinase
MRWRGIILTGTSGAGKSTISDLIRKRDESLELVKAVTTRDPRPDDEPGSYVHLAEREFDGLRDSLIIWAEYRGKRYAITRYHLADVERRGKTPVLVITPRSLSEFLERSEGEASPPFLTVFIDAPDDELDARLGIRGDSERRPAVLAQRGEDRSHRVACRRGLENRDREHSLSQLLDWWREPPDSPEEAGEST